MLRTITQASLTGVSHGQVVGLLALTALTAAEPQAEAIDRLKI